MKFVTFLKLLPKLLDPVERDATRFLIADRFLALWYPKLTYSEYGRVWMDDRKFLDYYRKFDNLNFHSADRKYFLNSLLNLIDGLPGDSAECGAFHGASSWLICEHLKNTAKIHHIFDSFEGLSDPSETDGRHWQPGDLQVDEAAVRNNLSSYRVETYKGWIPSRFEEISDQRFCFVHIDVDLYQPTLDSLNFFYPRMVSGGILICDDYGFSTCPGAKQAFDTYMQDKEEKIIHVPTAQGFIIKK